MNAGFYLLCPFVKLHTCYIPYPPPHWRLPGSQCQPVTAAATADTEGGPQRPLDEWGSGKTARLGCYCLSPPSSAASASADRQAACHTNRFSGKSRCGDKKIYLQIHGGPTVHEPLEAVGLTGKCRNVGGRLTEATSGAVTVHASLKQSHQTSQLQNKT